MRTGVCEGGKQSLSIIRFESSRKYGFMISFHYTGTINWVLCERYRLWNGWILREAIWRWALQPPVQNRQRRNRRRRRRSRRIQRTQITYMLCISSDWNCGEETRKGVGELRPINSPRDTQPLPRRISITAPPTAAEAILVWSGIIDIPQSQLGPKWITY